MSNLASDYIDLLASGDKQKIGCVLMAAGAAAGVSGLAAGAMFAPANVVPGAGQAINATAAGIGAVLGALASAKMAYKMCGGEATRNSLDDLVFNNGKVSSVALENYEGVLMKDYGVSKDDARKLSKAAYVYSMNNPSMTNHEASFNERKNAVAALLDKLNKNQVT